MFKTMLRSMFQKSKTSVNAFLDVKYMKQALAVAPFALMSSSAFADFSTANKLLTDVQIGLKGFSLVVVTIAILIAGYKILFQGQTFREVAPILIGGVLIGSASTIASIFVAK